VAGRTSDGSQHGVGLRGSMRLVLRPSAGGGVARPYILGYVMLAVFGARGHGVDGLLQRESEGVTNGGSRATGPSLGLEQRLPISQAAPTWSQAQ
jgi:hypothetical protein